MFKLSAREKAEVAANCDHLSGLRYSPALPCAFTEHGAIMAAKVLNSTRAVRASVIVVRAFVRLRQVLSTHKDLEHKLLDLERRLGRHDVTISELMMAIRELMEPSEPARRERIGFHRRPAPPGRRPRRTRVQKQPLEHSRKGQVGPSVLRHNL